MQSYRLNTRTAQLAECERDALVCHQNQQVLEEAVEEQNEEVEQLGEDAEQADQNRKDRAEARLAQPLPQATGRGAEELNRWLDTF